MEYSKKTIITGFALLAVIEIALMAWTFCMTGLYAEEAATLVRIAVTFMILSTGKDAISWRIFLLQPVGDNAQSGDDTPSPARPKGQRTKCPARKKPACATVVAPITMPEEIAPIVSQAVSVTPAMPQLQFADPEETAKERFDAVFAHVLQDTGERTDAGSDGELCHYAPCGAYSSSEKSLLWMQPLLDAGFELMNKTQGEMQDVVMYHSEHKVKVTSVSGHINVMFFNSQHDLKFNLLCTAEFLRRIKKNERDHMGFPTGDELRAYVREHLMTN